jgi:hypothetical protein
MISSSSRRIKLLCLREYELASLCLMSRFTEEVGGFQECAHGGGKLRRCS